MLKSNMPSARASARPSPRLPRPWLPRPESQRAGAFNIFAPSWSPHLTPRLARPPVKTAKHVLRIPPENKSLQLVWCRCRLYRTILSDVSAANRSQCAMRGERKKVQGSHHHQPPFPLSIFSSTVRIPPATPCRLFCR